MTIKLLTFLQMPDLLDRKGYYMPKIKKESIRINFLV